MPNSSLQLNHTEIVVGLHPKLSRPGAVAFDSKNNLYVSDTDNHRVLLISMTGQVTVFAGKGTTGGTNIYAGIDKGSFSGDGGPAINAQLNFPHGLAFDSDDNLYIADSGNHRIRKVSSDGMITTIAGTDEAGFFGDGGPASMAKLNFPRNLTIDANDNLYFVDTRNNRIRMIDGKGNGNIQTIAGTEKGDASTGDGDLATKATLFFDHRIYVDGISIAVDGQGNVYIGQIADHRIRRIDNKDKIIRTFVGGNGQGFTGDKAAATAAQLSYPYGIATDSNGNLYIADADNHRIRKVDDKGIIDTVAGKGVTDDASALTTIPLYGAQSLAFDRHGNLYIAEADYNTIRKIKLENPDFSIDMDNPFSVIAAVTMETFKKNKTSGKVESIIATGNIVSKYAPYQNTAGGWQLSIVADPPEKDKGTYISFSIHSKAGEDDKVNSCEVMALLKNNYVVNKKESKDNDQELENSGISFKKYTDIITAVKDKGSIKVYQNGKEIGKNTYTGKIDVNNAEALNIGKLLPTPEDDTQLGGMIRKISLWNSALSLTEIINYTNCMMDPEVNFPLKMDYQLKYNTPKKPEEDFTLQIKGTLSLTGKTGLVYSAVMDKTDKIVPEILDLDGLKQKVVQELSESLQISNLGAFTFNIQPNDNESMATITASHANLSNPQEPALTAQNKFSYAPASIDKNQSFEAQIPDLDSKKLEVAKMLFLSTLDIFTFDPPKKDDKEFKVTIRASYSAQPSLTAEDIFPYDPDVNDDFKDEATGENKGHGPLFDKALKEAAEKLTEQANKEQNEVSYQYDAGSQQVSGKIDPGKLSNCVGFWNLYKTSGNDGSDLSAWKNNVPSDQWQPKDISNTVLPFFMEEQAMNNWCWAATSLSVKKFYNPSNDDQQCKLVTTMFQNPLVFRWKYGPKKPIAQTASCCTDPDRSLNDLPYFAYVKLQKINLVQQNYIEGTVWIQDIDSQLMAGRPIPIRVKWAEADSNIPGSAHFMAISGHYTEKSDNPSGTPIEWVVINDPWYGMSFMKMNGNNFSDKYQGSGDWKNTYYTRPVWISPPTEASTSDQAGAL